MWEILRDKLNKNKPRTIPTFLNNGNDAKESTEKKDITELFAKHFSKIGEELVRDLLDESSDYTRFLPQNEVKSLYMLQVSFDEYQKAISDLKRGNSTSVDDISTNLLKKISGVIYEPLAHVINTSIKNGVFPDLLKKAKIIPIFKKGEAQDPNNYRPIALLSPLAKVLKNNEI
ncbi:uncharacterized protein LOC136036786 [Artemia franciscana]|uniref:uncharacterized protein LOC136036785 n=1 Tax=Artemia franciscana TaxID=6661 RepID=UPI0032D9B33B